MGLTSLLFSHPAAFAAIVVLLLYSVIFHELAHGWTASLFGDDTAKLYGRLTLNPFPHIDPLGALMLFLVGFGWARPVPVNFDNLRNSRLGLVCVSLAGPLTNVLIAVLAVFLLKSKVLGGGQSLAGMLTFLARINVGLGAFNLIPVPPLDGSRILMEFLPAGVRQRFGRLDRAGFLVLILLLWTGWLNPVIAFMQRMIYGLISLLLGR